MRFMDRMLDAVDTTVDVAKRTGEVAHLVLADLQFKAAKRLVAERLTKLVTHPAVPVATELQPAPAPHLFNTPRFVGGLHKCEPETIGLLVLALSARPNRAAQNADVWYTVPWPSLAVAYSRSLGRLLQSLCWDANPFLLWDNIERLNRVPVMPAHDGSDSIGFLGGPMLETTRTNGIPNFLVIGTRILIDRGYVTLIRWDGQPDLLLPTQQLINACANERKAA